MRIHILAILFVVASSLQAQNFPVANLQKHVRYLASDQLKGRAPGEKGEALAAKYIAAHFKNLGLSPKGTKGYFQPFTYKQNENPHDHETGTARNGKNVVGYLDNGADFTIVIGAHYDHLGTDGRGSSLDPNPKGKIHNGADDNASGTAGMMELARHYATNNEKEAMNFLFIAFSAEEAGLIGSKHYCANPSIDLRTVQLMINMDMIGRYNPQSKQLIISGTGTAAELEKQVLALNPSDFNVVSDSSGMGPSDYSSFYLKNIPVLAFFTGAHSEYHKPGDDEPLINYKGESAVLDYVEKVSTHYSKQAKLNFLPTRQKSASASDFKVTLGIIPDYAWQKAGVHIDGVSENRPASKAGLLTGDVIIQLGELKITGMDTYMQALGKFEKGQTTTVEVERNGKVLQFPITF